MASLVQPAVITPQDLAALYAAERKKREELEGALQLAAKELTFLRSAASKASTSAASALQGRASDGSDLLREQLKQSQTQCDSERKKREELEVRGRAQNCSC